MSHGKQSETSIISSYELENDIYLVDTPGFNDTNGAEVDISN